MNIQTDLFQHQHQDVPENNDTIKEHKIENTIEMIDQNENKYLPLNDHMDDKWEQLDDMIPADEAFAIQQETTNQQDDNQIEIQSKETESN